MLDHANKHGVFVGQLACLEVLVWKEDIIMTLLESFPALYEYLITALETMLIKKLTMEYMMACLMHEMSMHEELEPKAKTLVMVSCQIKVGDGVVPN